MKKLKLLDNSGTDAYRKMAFELRDAGVTEERYIEKVIDPNFPGWREDKEWKPRIELLLEILFHYFFE